MRKAAWILTELIQRKDQGLSGKGVNYCCRIEILYSRFEIWVLIRYYFDYELARI